MPLVQEIDFCTFGMFIIGKSKLPQNYMLAVGADGTKMRLNMKPQDLRRKILLEAQAHMRRSAPEWLLEESMPNE